ncbi:2OG-Fe(II) oxygenase [Xanthobacter autotrophicus]|uniref:2OG-Fe(II) oxygenase n=1 Tax=Xanthobacter autotrophicus TaxID=280 RepID=UPI003726B6DB
MPPRPSSTLQFGSHVDGAIRAIPGAGRRMLCDVSNTVFLTDPADYNGGELLIEDTFGVHEVKLPAGSTVVYPSSSLHSVKEITRGSGWGAFFWTQSMIKEDERRALLYDLDLAVIAIRSRLPDHDPAVLAIIASITTCYGSGWRCRAAAAIGGAKGPAGCTPRRPPPLLLRQRPK